MIKQLYKKLSAWMILVGLFLQVSMPVIAAIESSNLDSSEIMLSEKSGVPIKRNSFELEESETVDVTNFNVHGLIEQIVVDAVEQGYENNLSSALMRCYKLVSEGKTVLDADILIEAMPELLQYAIEQEKIRASRPDAPTASANNPIVACGGDCDLTQLIRLLASIRARIGTVNDSPCCGTILGILGDACNVPCIGENGSISEVLCEILDCCTQTTSTFNIDLSGVYTVLANLDLNCSTTVEIDLNGVFTTLANLDLNCSTTVEIDLNGVFTVLANLDLNCSTTVEIDLNGVFTTLANLDLNCSTTVEVDLNGVFTVLADLDLNCSTTVVIDLNGVFTTLANLDLNCSTTVEIDLNGVFTVLANLDLNCSTTVEIDLNGVFTTLANLDLNCSTTVEIDLNGVFTVLADLDLNCSTTVEIDLHGVFTTLANLDLNCSTTVEIDLNGVFTVLADLDLNCSTTVVIDLNGVFTTLANLDLNCSTTVEIDLNGVFTVLANLDLNCSTTVVIDLNGVFTVLADIKSDIFDTQTLIIDDFHQTWTMIEDCCACGPIPLYQSDVNPSTNAITLVDSGMSYCLAENITGTIVISASDVTVYGSGHIVTGRVRINGVNAIVRNAKIKSPTPVNNAVAFTQGAVDINASNAQILDSLIDCGTTSVLNVDGRVAITINGEKAIIKGCNITAGSGNGTGLSGYGITIGSASSLIEDTIVQSGNGSSFNNAISVNADFVSINNVTVLGGNALSSGSPLVQTNGYFVSILNSTLIGGVVSNVNGQDAFVGCGRIDNVVIRGGDGQASGGSGIRIVGNTTSPSSITNSTITGGFGTTVFGGFGISVENSSNVMIDKVDVLGGSGSAGGSGIFADNTTSYISISNSKVFGGNSSGVNSSGAHGIQSRGNYLLVDTVEAIGTNGIDGDFVGTGGKGIFVQSGSNATIRNSIGRGGHGGDSVGGTGGFGGDGIEIAGSYGVINDSVAIGGNGGNTTVSADFGGQGGSGILLRESNMVVEGSTAKSGFGGNGTAGTANGGNGGSAIHVLADQGDITSVIITQCDVIDSGSGGTSVGGTPGNGGHGINIIGTSVLLNLYKVTEVQIRDCTINNVGQAVAPGIGGDGIHIESVDGDLPVNCIQIINTKIVGSGGNGVDVLIASDIEFIGCSASCNGLDGFVGVSGSDLIFDNCIALNNTGTGINIIEIDTFQIISCKVQDNFGDGIGVAIDSSNGQVVSNRSNRNSAYGIANYSGSTYFGNNIATNHTTNYSAGVNFTQLSLDPTQSIGYWANVEP